MENRAFNDNWMFMKGSGGSLTELLLGDKLGLPEEVRLPHDASIRLPRDPKHTMGNGNGFFQQINCHYTKSFVLPAEDEGKKIFLRFGGIYQNAWIYLNGAFAGKHDYGYGCFTIDATAFVTFGEERENFIKVVVKNGLDSGRWYTGTGIYRKVELLVSERTHFDVHGIALNTAYLEPELAAVDVKAALFNETVTRKTLLLTVNLFDREGRKVAEDTKRLTMEANREEEYLTRLFVRDPMPWDTEHPYLYRYEAILAEGETVLDRTEGSFGIRTVSVDPIRGLRINGKTVKLRGGCIHHDNGILGAVEYPHTAEVRVKKLKDAGFNAIRSSHYPVSGELLSACDRLGLYIMDEYTDVWTYTKVDFDYGMHAVDDWREDLTEMVKKDRNHPSVIFYSIGNEIQEAGNDHDVQWGKKFSDLIRRLDPSRPVVHAVNPGMMLGDLPGILLAKKQAEKAIRYRDRQGDPGAEAKLVVEINTLMSELGPELAKLAGSDLADRAIEEAAGQIDVLGYNYGAERYETEGAKYPNRVLVGSETKPGELDRNWALVEKLPYLIGDFDWTAWDYLGEPGIGDVLYGEIPKGFYGAYPYKAARCSDIDLLGHRRALSYWRESIWNDKGRPAIFVRNPTNHGQVRTVKAWGFTDAVRCWSFAGMEGRLTTVEVYSSADEVELLVNGKSAGRKKPGEEKRNIALFETPYEPGTLEAIAYCHGLETGRDRLDSLRGGVVLAARADRETIPSDGSDIAYIDLSLQDENGTLCMDRAPVVSVEIEGEGELLGFGSADPKSEENYYDRAARFFEGRLLAAVRGVGRPGTIRVCFRTEGMDPSCVVIAAI